MVHVHSKQIETIGYVPNKYPQCHRKRMRHEKVHYQYQHENPAHRSFSCCDMLFVDVSGVEQMLWKRHKCNVEITGPNINIENSRGKLWSIGQKHVYKCGSVPFETRCLLNQICKTKYVTNIRYTIALKQVAVHITEK